MKKLLILVCFIALSTSALAQNTYTVNGETVALKTEIDGSIDLLWNTINNNFRYFVRDTDGTILELKNTKDSITKKYQEEYKTVLSTVTKNAVSTDKVNLILPSLKTFFDSYNAMQSESYEVSKKTKLQTRIGVFGGVTNNPFVENKENKTTPIFGFEFEIFEATKMPRHSGFLSMRHALKQDDINYTATQLALGYRYRFINQPSFNIYANVKFATLNFSKTLDESATAFDVPFIFGLGADIKISENSFITFAYNELFAILLDNQGNFPIDFAIGYKMNL